MAESLFDEGLHVKEEKRIGNNKQQSTSGSCGHVSDLKEHSLEADKEVVTMVGPCQVDSVRTNSVALSPFCGKDTCLCKRPRKVGNDRA